MPDTTQKFKPRERRKAAPVKRVTVSEEARKAYEALVKERDEADRTYGRHLSEEQKGRR